MKNQTVTFYVQFVLYLKTRHKLNNISSGSNFRLKIFTGYKIYTKKNQINNYIQSYLQHMWAFLFHSCKNGTAGF